MFWKIIWNQFIFFLFFVPASCFVGQQNTHSLLALVLAPQFVYSSLSTTFLLIGLASLALPRRPTVMPTSTTTAASALTASHTNPLTRPQREAPGKLSPIKTYQRQKQLLTRVGIFSCLYTMLMICITSTTFYEWWGRETWLRAPEPSAAPRAPARPLLQFFVLRLVITLGAGVITGACIWWPEVTNTYRKLLHCKQSPHKCSPLPSVVHCYNPGGTTGSVPHQIHHLGHLTPPQHPLLHQHTMTNSQMPYRNNKKYRKHRKHHSGSETQV